MSRKIKEYGVDVTGDICQKKWNNMMMTYRKIADSNNKTGRGKNFWPYFEKIDEIMGKTGSMVSVSELYKPPTKSTLNEKNPDSPTISSDTATESKDDLTNISIIPENSNKNICKKKRKRFQIGLENCLIFKRKK